MTKRANGEGSIYRRKDGRWVGSIHVRTAAGTWERRQIYGKTRREVEGKFSDLLKQIDAGTPITPASTTVGDYLEEWATSVAARRVRPNTLANYRHFIRQYLVPALGKKRLAKLTARDVRQFVSTLADKGVGARTVQYAHATLRAALEDATREELIPRNVARLVQVKRPEAAERQPLTVEDARQLLKSARDHRLYALFVVFVLLGLRRSEALGLQWDAVDLQAGSMEIRKTLHRTEGELRLLPPKTRRSRRTIPLPAPVFAALREHRERQLREGYDSPRWKDQGFVFATPLGTPIDPRNCTRIFQRQCELAGVPVVPLHVLRHTCVSLLLDLGVPPRTVMEIAGHSALEMTMNVYGHVSLDSRRDALDRLAGLLED